MRIGLKQLASQGRRFGHRRLRLLSARQEGRINRKKLYRLYREERWPQRGLISRVDRSGARYLQARLLLEWAFIQADGAAVPT